MFIKIIFTKIRQVLLSKSGRHHDSGSKRLITFSTSLIALILAGALSAEVRTGGTGRTISYGQIDAFGSIVVNGIHHDETAANIIINDVPQQTKAQLKLGMIVDIDGDVNYTLGTGVANVVRVNRRLFGQIDSIVGNATEVRVLNQRISISTTTRADGFTTPSELQPGDWVAIHGLDDPARQMIAATLIERMMPVGQVYSEIRGTISHVRNGLLRIGGLNVVYDSTTIGAGSELENGRFVAASGVYLSPAGLLFATNLAVTREVEVQEQAEAKLQGFIADFRGPTDFTISGVPVDASHATFENGAASDLKPGARVTVEGTVLNGVLIAHEISVASGLAQQKSKSVEVEGEITQLNSANDFMIKTHRIDASRIVLGKSSALPALGKKAHVVGAIRTDGTIQAVKLIVEK